MLISLFPGCVTHGMIAVVVNIIMEKKSETQMKSKTFGISAASPDFTAGSNRKKKKAL